MDFYARGRKSGGHFERGNRVGAAVHSCQPDSSTASSLTSDGDKQRLSAGDIALASRLSFFPVEQPARRAAGGACGAGETASTRGVRAAGAPHAGRCALEDADRQLAEQWLHLRNLKNSNPDLGAFPDFDDTPPGDEEETELFFNSIMREDRSVMDLLNADYTFVNERLARHYGMPASTAAGSAGCRCERIAPRPVVQATS